jgi:hypothetical protein
MLFSGTITVNSSTPTLIIDGAQLGEYVGHIQCSDPVVIGDSSVTTSNGLLLVPGTTNTDNIFTIHPQSEDVYAVSVGANALVGVFAYTA